MFRKFSTKLKSRKEEANGINGLNGTNGTSSTKDTTHRVTNGTNGESKGKPSLKERHSSFGPFKSKKEPVNNSPDHKASRRDVENSFEQFSQLIHVSVCVHSYPFFVSTAMESQSIVRERQSFFTLISQLEGEKLIL